MKNEKIPLPGKLAGSLPPSDFEDPPSENVRVRMYVQHQNNEILLNTKNMP